MAVINSLVCWGGRTGRTVAISNASPAVVTFTNHGVSTGLGLVFSTTGTLPAGVSTGVTYYAKSTSANTFNLYDTAANAIAGGATGRIDTSTAGSGTHTAKSDLIVNPSTRLVPYGLSDLSRWGASGSERIYDSINSAKSTQESTAGYTDEIVIECGEALTEYTAWGSTNNGKAVSETFISRINGIRTTAFHNGVPGAGLICAHVGTSAAGWYYPNNKYLIIDGISFVRNMSVATTSYGILPTCYQFINNLVANIGASCRSGIEVGGEHFVANNLVYGGTFDFGGIALSTSGATVAHNTVTKCSKGFGAVSLAGTSYIYNNLAVGNTVNWSGGHVYASTRMYGNIGETSDKTTFTNTAASTVLTLAVTPRFNSNQQVMVRSSGTLPAPLNDTTTYFVRAITGNTITLSTSYGGGNITLTNTGTGEHTISFVWGSMGQVENYVDFSAPNAVFVDWTNNDFRPAGAGGTPGARALMVDTAKDVPLLSVTQDINGNERPYYAGGAAEYKDVGAFEHVYGYGPRPASTTVTFLGVPVGVELHVYLPDAPGGEAGTEVAGVESCVSDQQLTWPVYAAGSPNNNVIITLIKRGLGWRKFTYPSKVGNQQLPIFMTADLGYNNPA